MVVWGQAYGDVSASAVPDPFTAAERDIRALAGAAWWPATPPLQRQNLIAGRMLALPDGTWWLFGSWARWYRWTPGDGEWHLCPAPRSTATRTAARPLPQGAPVPRIPPHLVPAGPDLAYEAPPAQPFVDAGVPPEVTARVRATVESAAALPAADYPHDWATFAPSVPSTVAVTWGVMLWAAAAPVFDSRLDDRLLGLWAPYRARPLPDVDGPRWLTPPPLQTLAGLYAERLRAGRVDAAVVILRTMWAAAGALREDARFRPRADALLAVLGATLANPAADYGALPYGDHALVQQWLTRCPPALAPALRIEASPGEHFRGACYDLAGVLAPIAGAPDAPDHVEPRLLAAAFLAADLAVVRRDVAGQVIAWLDPEARHTVQTLLGGGGHPLRGLWPHESRLPPVLRDRIAAIEPADRRALLATMYAADLAWCRLGGGIPARPRGFPVPVAILAEILGTGRATSTAPSEPLTPPPGIVPGYPGHTGPAGRPVVMPAGQQPPTGPPGQAPTWAAPSPPAPAPVAPPTPPPAAAGPSLPHPATPSPATVVGDGVMGTGAHGSASVPAAEPGPGVPASPATVMGDEAIGADPAASGRPSVARPGAASPASAGTGAGDFAADEAPVASVPPSAADAGPRSSASPGTIAADEAADEGAAASAPASVPDPAPGTPDPLEIAPWNEDAGASPAVSGRVPIADPGAAPPASPETDAGDESADAGPDGFARPPAADPDAASPVSLETDARDERDGVDPAVSRGVHVADPGAASPVSLEADAGDKSAGAGSDGFVWPPAADTSGASLASPDTGAGEDGTGRSPAGSPPERAADRDAATPTQWPAAGEDREREDGEEREGGQDRDREDREEGEGGQDDQDGREREDGEDAERTGAWRVGRPVALRAANGPGSAAPAGGVRSDEGEQTVDPGELTMLDPVPPPAVPPGFAPSPPAPASPGVPMVHETNVGAFGRTRVDTGARRAGPAWPAGPSSRAPFAPPIGSPAPPPPEPYEAAPSAPMPAVPLPAVPAPPVPAPPVPSRPVAASPVAVPSALGWVPGGMPGGPQAPGPTPPGTPGTSGAMAGGILGAPVPGRPLEEIVPPRAEPAAEVVERFGIRFVRGRDDVAALLDDLRRTAGARSAGPAPGGAHSAGPALGGSASGGPASGEPASGEPASGGADSSGPEAVGAKAAGAGPVSVRPVSARPVGRVDLDDPESGSGESGGTASGRADSTEAEIAPAGVFGAGPAGVKPGGVDSGGADSTGEEAAGAESGGPRPGSGEPGDVTSTGADPGDPEPGSGERRGTEPGGGDSTGVGSTGAENDATSNGAENDATSNGAESNGAGSNGAESNGAGSTDAMSGGAKSNGAGSVLAGTGDAEYEGAEPGAGADAAGRDAEAGAAGRAGRLAVLLVGAPHSGQRRLTRLIARTLADAGIGDGSVRTADGAEPHGDPAALVAAHVGAQGPPLLFERLDAAILRAADPGAVAAALVRARAAGTAALVATCEPAAYDRLAAGFPEVIAGFRVCRLPGFGAAMARMALVHVLADERRVTIGGAALPAVRADMARLAGYGDLVGARLVEAYLDRAVARHTERACAPADRLVLGPDDVAGVAEELEPALRAPGDVDGFLRTLDEMIGLDEVKRAVHALVAEARAAVRRTAPGAPAARAAGHLVFTGRPGTGRRTVAGLVGGAYAALNVLGSGHVAVCSARDLAGDDAAAKVEAQVARAAGGVLLIEDAPLLGRAPVAVAALLRWMEERRGTFVVIWSGRPEEMAAFLDADPRVRAGFDRVVEFREPTDRELVRLFTRFAERDLYLLDEELRVELLGRFGELRRSPEFAFAHTVRWLFDQAVAGQAARLAGAPVSAAEVARLSARDLPADVPPGGRHEDRVRG